MDFYNKDWLKFALDLYEKTRGMGLMNNWDKDKLGSLIEMASKFNFSGPDPNGKGGKFQQEAGPMDQERATDEVFWRQESAPPYGSAFTSGAAKGGYAPPISIYETGKEVNIHVILPGVASKEDLVLFLSREALELSGARAAGGFSGDKRNENFYKMIRLPAPVEPSGATAIYRNGFLYIHAPKKSHLPPQKIEVKFE